MTTRLDPEEKRLRSLSDGRLADEVGLWKAEAAATADRINALKSEAIRRGLMEADGDFYRITLAEPGTRLQLDRAALEAAHPKIVPRFLVEVATDWVLRCVARRQVAAGRAAA